MPISHRSRAERPYKEAALPSFGTTDGWDVIEDEAADGGSGFGNRVEHIASVLCCSNGRVSARAVADYGTLDVLQAVHSVAGCSVRVPIDYPYAAVGLPEAKNVAVPACRVALSVEVNGVAFNMKTARAQRLDMAAGTHTMTLRLESSAYDGSSIRVAITRLAALDATLALVDRVVVDDYKPGSGDAPTAVDVAVAIDVVADTRVWCTQDVSAAPDGPDAELVVRATAGSDVPGGSTTTTSLVSRHVFGGEAPWAPVNVPAPSSPAGTATPPMSARQASTHGADKAFATSFSVDRSSADMHANTALSEHAEPITSPYYTPSWQPVARRCARATLQPGKALSVVYASQHTMPSAPDVAPVATPIDFDKLVAEQAAQLRSVLWGAGDDSAPTVRVAHVPGGAVHRFTQAMRFNMFALATAAWGAGPRAAVTFTGLSSDGSGGVAHLQHVLVHATYYIHTCPPLARRMLSSIVWMLPGARDNAQKLGCRGALFPALTLDGSDGAAYFINSSAKFHVSADVGTAAIRYVESCHAPSAAPDTADDAEFAVSLLEMVLECGRALLALGQWDEATEVFRIDSATGPDEYNPLVDGQFYTHVAARALFEGAVRILDALHAASPSLVETMLHRIEWTDAERTSVARAANGIRLHRDDKTRVFLAHETFDALQPWKTEPVGFPLSLHVHPLVIYKRKVVQVPDVLLAMLHYPADGDYGPADLARAVDYYSGVTTHDVPWALGVTAASAFRVHGDVAPSEAARALRILATLNLDETLLEASEGLRLPSMAYTWFALASGVLGLRIVDGELYLDPCLPVGWDGVVLPLRHRGAQLRVEVAPESVSYTHLGGANVCVRHGIDGAHRVHVSSQRRSASVPRSRFPLNATADFDAIVVLLDAVVEGFHRMNFEAWRDVLAEYFDAAQHRTRMIANSSNLMVEALADSPETVTSSTAPTMRDEDSERAPRHVSATASFSEGHFADHGVSAASPQQQADRPAALTMAEYIATFLSAPNAGTQMQYSGLDTALSCRGISLELGAADDPAVSDTRFGLANAKVNELRQRLDTGNAALNFIGGTVSLLRDARRRGVRTCVVTYSRSAMDILEHLPDIRGSVSAFIDGVEARGLGVQGRPTADLFTAAARKLHVDPKRCVVLASELDCGYDTSQLEGRFAGVVNIIKHHLVEESGGDDASAAAAAAAAEVAKHVPPCVKLVPFQELPADLDGLQRVLAQ